MKSLHLCYQAERSRTAVQSIASWLKICRKYGASDDFIQSRAFALSLVEENRGRTLYRHDSMMPSVRLIVDDETAVEMKLRWAFLEFEDFDSNRDVTLESRLN